MQTAIIKLAFTADFHHSVHTVLEMSCHITYLLMNLCIIKKSQVFMQAITYCFICKLTTMNGLYMPHDGPLKVYHNPTYDASTNPCTPTPCSLVGYESCMNTSGTMNWSIPKWPDLFISIWYEGLSAIRIGSSCN